MTAVEGRAGVALVLPGGLRELADGRATVDVEGRTVGEALASLRRRLPAVYDRLVTERGELRPHIHVFVGGAEIRRTGGLETPIAAGAELVILRAVSGG